jgi:hypothetical protein
MPSKAKEKEKGGKAQDKGLRTQTLLVEDRSSD